MEQLKEHILQIMARKGKAYETADYLLKIPRSEMMSELSLLGFDHEVSEAVLEELCAKGILVIDEFNIYQYEEQPL